MKIISDCFSIKSILKIPKVKKRRRSCGNTCLLILGLTLVVSGAVIFFFFDIIYDAIIKSALTFNRDSKSFHVWRKNNNSLEIRIYIFNWTNPDQIENATVKPHFEELGPYVFWEKKEKINVTWHDNNATISYQHRKMYYFDTERSARNLSDVVNIINAVPLTIAYKARDYGYFPKRTISYSLSSLSSLYVTKEVREILFDGYDESILSILSSFPMTSVQDRFGLFYGKNGTVGPDGEYSMRTTNDANFGRIATWNNQNHSDFYDGYCGEIRGSAGEFHPINRQRDYIEFFSAELCKFAVLEYERDVDIKGVHGYKYSANNIFDNGTLRQENHCFCTGECIPNGVLNVSSCRQGSPTFLSLPHFFNADAYYRNSIEGMKPDPKRHEFFMTLEPKSAIVMDIAARMQVNFLLQPIDYITMYQKVPRIFMPIFYVDQVVSMTDELAGNLQKIQNLPEIGYIASLLLFILGVTFLIWMVVSMYCCYKDDIQTEQKIQKEEEPLRT